MAARKLILVHGIFNSALVMAWMKRRLEAQGFECFTPSLIPMDARHGIEYAAQQLKRLIDAKFGEDDTISLIGFSMGGIVARYYLQNLGGARRTTHFFSISTPHHGSYMAYLPYPSKGFKQMRPKSEFMHLLQRTQSALTGVNNYSYWTWIDFTIIPSSSSYWTLATNKKFTIPLHMSMIFSPKIVNQILTELEGEVGAKAYE